MMSRIVRITESDLRAAVADERYWRVGHPERGAFQNWVGQGFRALNPSDGAARNTVWVRAYMRDGHWVSAHWRRTPSSHATEGTDTAGTPAGDVGVHLANWWRNSLFRILRGPADGRGGGVPRNRTAPLPRERRLGTDGRDVVQDLRDDGRWMSPTRRDVDQWERGGGEARRAADLQRLRPTGETHITDNGHIAHRLEDGRTATIRPSTTPGYDGRPTLEIGTPKGGSNPWGSTITDKFRY
jgi:hypothetical protein